MNACPKHQPRPGPGFGSLTCQSQEHTPDNPCPHGLLIAGVYVLIHIHQGYCIGLVLSLEKHTEEELTSLGRRVRVTGSLNVVMVYGWPLQTGYNVDWILNNCIYIVGHRTGCVHGKCNGISLLCVFSLKLKLSIQGYGPDLSKQQKVKAFEWRSGV